MHTCPVCGEHYDEPTICPGCLVETSREKPKRLDNTPRFTNPWDAMTYEQQRIDALMREKPGR